MGYAVQHGMHYLVTAVVSCNPSLVLRMGSDNYPSSWDSSLQELRLGLCVQSDMPRVPFLLVAVTPLGSLCEALTYLFGLIRYIDYLYLLRLVKAFYAWGNTLFLADWYVSFGPLRWFYASGGITLVGFSWVIVCLRFPDILIPTGHLPTCDSGLLLW
jgi:hypothetical protein